jgi:hypothetical protein
MNGTCNKEVGLTQQGEVLNGMNEMRHSQLKLTGTVLRRAIPRLLKIAFVETYSSDSSYTLICA